MSPGAIHAFLAGTGRDGAGRRLADVLALDDRRIDAVHDFIQWLFPLRDASRAVPGSPVLTEAEAQAIRADPEARAGLDQASARMARFYRDNDVWLVAYDHNHLRITRILASIRDLRGEAEARAFHAAILERNRSAGAPVNPQSVDYWAGALG